MSNWEIFTGDGVRSNRIVNLPDPPSWRQFDVPVDQVGLAPLGDKEAVMMVNAALVLRRPLLVTGPPGSGKSTLAKLVARELDLGPVLRWPITTSSRLQDGLYEYDAIGRVHDEDYWNGRQQSTDFDIGRYIRLGPLGTALLPSDRPRVLLIDEIDKSDIDLPNDLLHVFEDGEFTIKELERLPPADEADEGVEADEGIDVRTADNKSATVRGGVVRCTQFPFVLLTSNGERTFPTPFLRRCLRVELKQPTDEQLRDILNARIGGGLDGSQPVDDLVKKFKKACEDKQQVASDQVLNAVYVAFSLKLDGATREKVTGALLKELG